VKPSRTRMSARRQMRCACSAYEKTAPSQTFAPLFCPKQ
jgi:hypothetical protein